MEDVDKVTVKFLHHHPKIWGLGEAQWFWGLGGGRGREAVFRTSLPPLEQRPLQYYRGAVPQ